MVTNNEVNELQGKMLGVESTLQTTNNVVDELKATMVTNNEVNELKETTEDMEKSLIATKDEVLCKLIFTTPMGSIPNTDNTVAKVARTHGR